MSDDAKPLELKTPITERTRGDQRRIRVQTNGQSDLCTCGCHRSQGRMKHIVACCRRCPHCNRGIFRSLYRDHEMWCSLFGPREAPRATDAETS